MIAAALASPIFSVQAVHAAEIKPAIQVASSDAGSTRTAIGIPDIFHNQIARASNENVDFDIASPGALRNKYTAIQRICRSLSRETREILLSCR
jgi:hypothetical protein